MTLNVDPYYIQQHEGCGDYVVRCDDPFCLARIEGGNLFLANVPQPGAEQWRLVTDADAEYLDNEYGDRFVDTLIQAINNLD